MVTKNLTPQLEVGETNTGSWQCLPGKVTSYSKIQLCRSHMKTFYVQFVDQCWTPKKIGTTSYSDLINSEHSTPVEKCLNTAHRFFKLLYGQNSINPKIFVVLFLSSCTKFWKNSNVSMAPRSRDERTSHTQESEKSAMIATLVKSADNPIGFQPLQR